MRTCTLLATIFSGCAVSASFGQTVIELTPEYLVSDLSEDGSVAVGNLFGPFETFRWTESTGEVLLGRGTVGPLGVGAGSPDVSYDGTRVSATITDETGSVATFGVWTEELGWASAQAPLGPSNSAVIDQFSLASTWGLSGDGEQVVGFYWTNMARAHPCLWNEVTGVTPLPVNATRSARVNAASYDGSVVCGWEESVVGAWQPTVWRNGVKIRLEESEVSVPVENVTADGSIVVGYTYVTSTANRHAAIWRWDGEEYVKEVLGQLPGTPAFNGTAVATCVSDDGSIVIGTNRYSTNPGAAADAFVWTESTGIVKAVDYFTGLGFVIPEGFEVREASAMSPDGSTFAFIGVNSDGLLQTLLLRLEDVCPGDCDESGAVDFNDLVSMLFEFGPADASVACDADGSGTIDFNDLVGALFLFGPCS